MAVLTACSLQGLSVQQEQREGQRKKVWRSGIPGAALAAMSNSTRLRQRCMHPHACCAMKSLTLLLHACGKAVKGTRCVR